MFRNKKEALAIHKTPIRIEQLIEELEPIGGNPDSETLMVCFAGARLGLGISLVSFRKCMAGLPVRVLMTPDTTRWWWSEGGILGGASDGTPSSSARALLRQRWPHRGLICEGTSLGASAALLAASLFGAEDVLAFAPLTFFGPWQRLRYLDRRWPGATTLRGSLSMKRIRYDLATVTSHPGYRRATIIADRTHRLDTLHAKRVSNHPGMSIRWESGGGHGVLRAMYVRGALGPLFAETVSRTAAESESLPATRGSAAATRQVRLETTRHSRGTF